MAEFGMQSLTREAAELWPGVPPERLQLIELPEDASLSVWFAELPRWGLWPGKAPRLDEPLPPEWRRLLIPLSEWHCRELDLISRTEPARGVDAVTAIALLSAAVFDQVTSWFCDPEELDKVALDKDWRLQHWAASPESLAFLPLAVSLRTTNSIIGALTATAFCAASGKVVRPADLRKIRSAGRGFGAFLSTHEAVFWGLSCVASWVEYTLHQGAGFAGAAPPSKERRKGNKDRPRNLAADPHRPHVDLLRIGESLNQAEKRLGLVACNGVPGKALGMDLRTRLRTAFRLLWPLWQRHDSPRALFEAALLSGSHRARDFCEKLLAERLPFKAAAEDLEWFNDADEHHKKCLQALCGEKNGVLKRLQLMPLVGGDKNAFQKVLDNFVREGVVDKVGPGKLKRGIFKVTTQGRELARSLGIDR